MNMNMDIDPFDQLAKTTVPTPPDQFGRELHDRLNRSLLVMHFVEFVLTAVPWAAWHMGCVVGAAARFTVTGRYDTTKRPRGRR